MANIEKGEFELKTTSGETYTLVMDVNAMVALEEVLSEPGRERTFQEVMELFQQGTARLKYIRAFVWACLRRYHRTITLDQAGDLIMEAGGLEGVLAQLPTWAGPTIADPKDVKELGLDRPRPQKAQTRRARTGGTGARSTSRAAKSV